MNKILETILRYLGQSSTYKGLFSVLAAFGVVLKPEMAEDRKSTRLNSSHSH